MLRQESDELRRLKELQIFFEVVVVGSVKEHPSVEALETHLLE
jgi:hypothetical protein